MLLAEYLKQKRGKAAELAEHLDVAPSVIVKWRDETVPRDRCPEIERFTGGNVTCEEMCPGVTWVRIKDKRWPHPKGRPLIDVAAEPTATQGA